MCVTMAAQSLTSIKSSDDKIQIVNQLLLPHTTEWLEIDTIEQAHDAIKTMKVSHPVPRSSHSTSADRLARATDPGRASYRVPRSPQRVTAPRSGSASRRPPARIPLLARISRGARLHDSRLFVHRTSDGRQPRCCHAPPLAYAPVVSEGRERCARDRGGFDRRR